MAVEMMDGVLERFATRAPVAVMVRALLANVLSERELDAIFRDAAERQVEGQLLFSQVAGLMQLVVTSAQRSLNAAYQLKREEMSVSITSVYNKLAGVEPQVTRELVSRTATKMSAIVDELYKPAMPLPGYRLRILDGFCFAATEHRIKETRSLKSGPLPGKALAVLDPWRRLITDIVPSQDGHQQERSILPGVVDLIEPNDCWITDRNFTTRMWLFEVALEKAFFVTRQHGQLPIKTGAELAQRGSTDSGPVFEQPATLDDGRGKEMSLRRVVVELDKPTEDGDKQLAILTNLPAAISAAQVADLYRKRWSIEAAFGELTQALRGEINTLGYPGAAMLAFALAVATYNVLSVVRAATAAAQTPDVADKMSAYYLANEVASVWEGMEIAVEESAWLPLADLGPKQLAEQLRELAGQIRIRRYQKHPRGPKKKPPKRTGKPSHVSTQKLLKARKR
jgi:hypothetical protein